MKTIKRRGIPISPNMNRVRLLILFIVTPIITWYAHQNFTNPMQYHLMVEIEQFNNTKCVHIFHENSFKRINHLYIQLSDTATFTPPVEKYQIVKTINDSLFIFTQKNEDEFFVDSMQDINLETVRIQKIDGNLLLTNQSGYFEKIVVEQEVHSTMADYFFDIDIWLTGKESKESILKTRRKLAPRLTILQDSIFTKEELQRFSNIHVWNGEKTGFEEKAYNRIKVVKN